MYIITCIIELETELVTFFIKHHLYLTNWLFKFAYLVGNFLKMNLVSFVLQGKQQAVRVARNKSQAFKWKLKCWKSMTMTLCLYLKNFFSDATGDDNNKYGFPVLYSWLYQHFKDLHSSVNRYFQMTNEWYHKIMLGKKIQPKYKIYPWILILTV